jgi:Asp-tRNA(Asn)/Glu-tRNA(Gln) amidotransferase A subunit family amidase
MLVAHRLEAAMQDLHELSATQAAQRIAKREITAEALVRSCLERAELRDPQVKAWVSLNAEFAVAQAQACDRMAPSSPLHGIPVGIKDVIDTADLPTQCNSPIYHAHRPRADASCVALVRRAGGVILGKTATTEFALQHPPATRNPHNLGHTPGGSSSGSAAAVGDRMVPLAFGTQTGGSTIRPAAFCGVVGCKPSFNRINRAGLHFVAESLDTIGVMARSVEDVALLLHAIGAIEHVDFNVTTRRAPRLAICRTPHWEAADQPTQRLIESSARTLEHAGSAVRELAFPSELADLYADHTAIIHYEAAHALAWEYRNHKPLLSASLCAHIESGHQITRARYDNALRNGIRYRAWLAQTFADFDFLLTPSAPGEAPEGITSTGNSIFNRPWTFFGVPCVTVPVGAGPRGLPLGVQVVGPYLEDAQTLAWAHWTKERL